LTSSALNGPLLAVAADVTAPGWGISAAMKFALEVCPRPSSWSWHPWVSASRSSNRGGFRTHFLDGSSLSVEANSIDDYAATVGATRGVPAAYNHAQPGDRARAAAAIVDLVEVDDPPLRLQLGADSVQRISAKIDFVRAELDRWREVALTTDYDDTNQRKPSLRP
jgi:hypothetical protein